MKKLLFWSFILLLFDQVTKYFMQGKTYFSGFFSLHYTINKGAAFGLLQGWKWLFIVVTFIVIFGIFYYYPTLSQKSGFILLLAGSIGNLIDRLFLGYVRDFISVRYFSVFNLADVYNVIGIGLLIYFMSKDPLRKI